MSASPDFASVAAGWICRIHPGHLARHGKTPKGRQHDGKAPYLEHREPLSIVIFYILIVSVYIVDIFVCNIIQITQNNQDNIFFQSPSKSYCQQDANKINKRYGRGVKTLVA